MLEVDRNHEMLSPDLRCDFFRNKKNEWTSPKNMGPSINTQGWEMAPSLSPDGKYLFFTRRKDFQTLEPSKIFWVDIRIIDKFR